MGSESVSRMSRVHIPPMEETEGVTQVKLVHASLETPMLHIGRSVIRLYQRRAEVWSTAMRST